jgi:hypothetical protein
LSITEFPAATSLLAVSAVSRDGWKEVDFSTKKRVCVPVTTLAAHALEQNIEYIKLLKLDAQGYELEVLRGCAEVLERIEYVYAEVQFVPLYERAPVWTEIVDYLHAYRFVPLRMGGFCVDSRGQLLQADLLCRNLRYDIAPRGTQAHSPF